MMFEEVVHSHSASRHRFEETEKFRNDFELVPPPRPSEFDQFENQLSQSPSAGNILRLHRLHNVGRTSPYFSGPGSLRFEKQRCDLSRSPIRSRIEQSPINTLVEIHI